MIASNTDSNTAHVPWWLWLNVLSLEAPLVAVLWQGALATMFHISLPPACYWVLGLAVWLIYILDRVMDGCTAPVEKQLSLRHAFYRRHAKLFAFGIIPVVAATVAWLALTEIPAGILWRGVALGYLVGLYVLHYSMRRMRLLYVAGNAVAAVVGSALLFELPVPAIYQLAYSGVLVALMVLSLSSKATQGFRMLPKELLCGFFFAVGSSLCVSYFTLDAHAGPFSWETLLFALVCSLNCVGIACYERDTDSVNDPNAITQTWPIIPRAYPLLLVMLGGLIIYQASRQMSVDIVAYSAVLLGCTVLLGVVHQLARRIRPEMSHALADGAIVAPMLLFVFMS